MRKVHCYWYATFFAVHAVCNRSELDGDIVFASPTVWPWLPSTARCKRCQVFNAEHFVTPVHVLAIEAALHGIASVFTPHPPQPAKEEM